MYYSAHGQHFAVAVERSVLLFDAYSHAQLGVLHGLASPATCLSWGIDDAYVCAGDAAGGLVAWERRTQRKVLEHRAKCAFTSLAAVARPRAPRARLGPGLRLGLASG